MRLHRRTPCIVYGTVLTGLRIASPQTSFGVRLSRIHFSPTVGEKWMGDKLTPKDICGEARLPTVKKQCKHISWQWKNICYTKPLQLVCEVGRKTYVFFISTSAAILKLMVEITSIFGSYGLSKNTKAWHDIFSFSDHVTASWNLCVPRDLGESKSKWITFKYSITYLPTKCSSSRLDEPKILDIQSPTK